MKTFIDDDFLLQSSVAQYLYHNHAKNMPVIDFHCHLSPQLIAVDHLYNNITQAWLYGDHYKWRAMRINGVDEKYCTGNAADIEKFQKWAETVPYTIRNPLYHWTHLELKNYFGIDEILNTASFKRIYETSSNLLNSKDYSVQNLLKKMKVEVVCTTDDPVDSLEYHIKMQSDSCAVKVIPAWRPDKAMAIGNHDAYNEYLDRLSEISGIDIIHFDHLLSALKIRHSFFHEHGCRLSDHGLETFYAENYTQTDINNIFNKIRANKQISQPEELQFKSAMLYELAIMNHEHGWAQQFHIGAIRNNNTRFFKIGGPDTGYDSIGDLPLAVSMSRFLDRLDVDNKLAKTILYNLNPSDNEVMATMTGNFQNGSVPGKMQWGSAWWFLDQKDGIEKQINTLSTMGLLPRFVGMLTDSRNFLSFPRHEYFRRILCNLIGKDVENGEIPNDMDLLGSIVEDICYNNAKNYFNFGY